MPRTLLPLSLALVLILAIGCISVSTTTVNEESAEALMSDHMVAEALLTAHYIDAAQRAGMSSQEINATLASIADETLITEFWVSDANGSIEFTNVPGLDFTFPTDPEAGTQAAPFADLLTGKETVVVQDVQARDADGALFKYVGVAGVDQPRIVQIGIEGASELDALASEE